MHAQFLTRRTAMVLAVATLTVAGTPPALAQQAPPDAIVGKWEADDGTVRMDMFKVGTEYQARFLYGNEVVEADGVTMKKDVNNPDPSLRSRSPKNIILVSGLRYGNGEWTGGSIYAANTGRTYNCDVKLQDGKLHLRGYLGVSMLGQTRVFHRML